MRAVSLILMGCIMVACEAFAVSPDFSYQPLPEMAIRAMREKGVWKDECPVPIERLNLVSVKHIDFEGKEQFGDLVVLDAVAPEVVKIFEKLYEMRFPIHKMQPIEIYSGDDERSMKDNNSSAFNCRLITGGSVPSIHAYGLAIDINPWQNPFVDIETKAPLAEVLPAAGARYLNRENLRPGMAETVVSLFKEHGFLIWGGNWNTPIDWQHFQTTRPMAQILAELPSEAAREFFQWCLKRPDMAADLKLGEDVRGVLALYKKDPAHFIAALDLR